MHISSHQSSTNWHLYASLMMGLVLALIMTWYFGFRQSLLWLIGIGYGLILNGAKFGFTTGWRQFIQSGKTDGINAQLFLLATLIPLSSLVLHLFPHIQAAVAPITISMLLGAFVFGGDDATG